MKRIWMSLLMVAVVLGASASSCEGDDEDDKPKCDKKCQRANDEYIAPDQYTDYFVNDSDGGKDLIFYVVEDIPFLRTTENPDGVLCDVLKSFDNEGVSTNVVCPAGASVFAGSGSQSNHDEEEK